MKWSAIVGVALAVVLVDVVAAPAWTLWIKQEAARLYSNKPPEGSTTWELQEAFATFEECVAGKQRSWQRLAGRYADLSASAEFDTTDSIQDEVVFLGLAKRGPLIGGHRNHHFHCLPDSTNPRE